MQKIIIANLILDPETRTLINQVGEAIILRPLPYNVLVLLLDRKEQSVSRDQLFDGCWEGAVVTDQALTNVISGLRRNFVQLKAVGIEIKTVSKIGYLLTIDAEYPVVAHQEPLNSLLSKKADLNQISELLSNNESKKEVPKQALIRQGILVKPSIASVLVALCLVVTIAVVYWNQTRLSLPHFLMKDNYQHFDINNTDYYLLNKTRKQLDVDLIQSQLESMELAECNAEVYIRIYDSAYEDDTYSLRGFMLSKSSSRNGNYALSQFSHQDLPKIMANALTRAKLICD
ncbi:winged helix-turn-helix domain-containing protein [Aliivibrio sp. EL58]|uniref:winged helix-turn-helix domain-containing protein n=1 Tax=Aliivibrio sp. EL58 TaxID=2107582 RepID=UPI000EFA9326|nr:winged helix-turn-helix domain-containing protein [Aliivibrio sp. EL58]